MMVRTKGVKVLLYNFYSLSHSSKTFQTISDALGSARLPALPMNSGG